MAASTPKRICILGSTGSVGSRTLDVIRDFQDRFRVVGLSAATSSAELARQVAEFSPVAACLSGAPPPDPAGPTRWFTGAGGLCDLVEACEPDLVVSSIVGAAGLEPTLRAIAAGADVGLANKEVLVAAGALTMRLARERGVKILPIDSEHNAIFQCLAGNEGQPLRRIVLTASGGPFRGWTRERLAAEATIESALRHPTWEMGRKITIDSATLMNKGFEVIEGHHLFAAPLDRIEVVVHPQSIVHSMVEFEDGSMLAQIGVTDMYFPIANILAYPDRLANRRFGPLDLASLGALTFEAPDREAFPCLDLAYQAARTGGTAPAALNAANEVAVERFLAGEIPFTRIPDVLEAALEAHETLPGLEPGEILEADARARELAREAVAARRAETR